MFYPKKKRFYPICVCLPYFTKLIKLTALYLFATPLSVVVSALGRVRESVTSFEVFVLIQF